MVKSRCEKLISTEICKNLRRVFKIIYRELYVKIYLISDDLKRLIEKESTR